MGTNELYYVYGMSTMFYAMMSYYFVRKGDRLSRLVALLMCTIGMQCLLINFYAPQMSFTNDYWWFVQSSFDMIAMPMYAFILIELVKPGKLRKRDMILMESPIVLLAVQYAATGMYLFYYVLVGLIVILGNYFLIWTLVQIPRYNNTIKEHFSYSENINLNWLRTILISFYVILGLWVINCLAIHINVEIIYMLLSMALWMTICYYIDRHEQVLDELRVDRTPQEETVDEPVLSELGAKIERLFNEKKIFLNPQLKVSDVAHECNTNRTYVSAYFNREAGTTFYEYVNTLRINYACELLNESNESIKIIAERSGFNSPQSFIRTFTKIKGVKPTDFRKLQ